ncbi:MAG TPA: sugar phosphate isomerase/epimerase [Acidimicrobiia bacterium]|nr:sugar phosphate isomerase/epimerase [Acidimicrobiia bacterium]
MLGRDDLVLTASSIGCPTFPVMIEAAVAGGYAGLSLWPPETYAPALARGATPARLRSMLDDAGVLAYEVDALVTWAGPNDPGEPYLRAAPRAFVLETAVALGARQANAIVVGERGTSLDVIADAVDRMCAEAATAGVRVAIEFARGALVRTLDDALAVRARLPHRDVGVTVDAWQLHWGPSTIRDLATVAGAAVFSVQLDDAPAVRPDDFARATYEGRLVPGEGAADLVGLLQTLDAIGYTGPVTVEAINADLIADHDPVDLARRLADATRAVVAASRA